MSAVPYVHTVRPVYYRHPSGYGPTLAVGDRTTCEAAVDRHRRAVPTPDPGAGT